MTCVAGILLPYYALTGRAGFMEFDNLALETR